MSNYITFLFLSFSVIISSPCIPLFAQFTEDEPLNNEAQDYIRRAEQYFDRSDLDSTRITMEELFNELSQNPEKYPADDWCSSCYSLARKIYDTYNWELLTDVFNPLLAEELIVNSNEVYGELPRLINFIAIGYRQQGIITESILAYKKAIEYANLSETINPRILPVLYTNLGNVLEDLGDLSEASIYYSEAMRQIDKNLNSESLDEANKNTYLDDKSTILNSIGLINQGLGKHTEALKNFSESLKIKEARNLSDAPSVNNNMGMSFSALGEYDNALFHFRKAVDFYAKSESRNQDWVQFHMNLSDLLIQLDRLSEAELMVNEILKIGPGIQGVTSGLMSNSNFQLATIQSLKGEFQLGITNIDLGLSKLTGIEVPDGEICRIPRIKMENSPFKVIQGIKFRARLLNDWGIAENDSSKLMMALENYQLAEFCIDNHRGDLQGEASKINLSRVEKQTFAENMDLVWRLFSDYPSDELIAQAFEAAEKGKAAGIWSLIQLSQQQETILPTEIIDENKHYKKSITDFDNQILNLKSVDPDNPMIDSLESQRFIIVGKLDSLTSLINQNFPNFGEHKFNNRIFSINEIQNLLDENQLIVQYYFSENYLHKIFVSRDSTLYETIPNPENLLESMISFNEYLRLTDYDYSSKDVANYQKIGSELYTILLNDPTNMLNNKELIILPDEGLAYIPFESLITTIKDSSNVDFRHFSYLILENSISYSYNASMWAMEASGTKDKIKNIFGIAPSYDFSSHTIDKEWEKWISQLPELPGTLEEVEILKRKFGAHTITGNKASEETFKRDVSDYKILHLAMHTLMSKEQVEQSFLAFTPYADETDDGRLYPNEIRNLDLNASLTILSACKSGTGELVSGEGVMSITRMFVLAGSSSVIMTLWSVDDQASLELINLFYNNLSNNMSISSALRSAKIEFINSADKIKAHPYFWSGFIQLGKDSTIQLKKTFIPLSWLIAGGSVLFILLTFWFYKKTKSRPGRPGV